MIAGDTHYRFGTAAYRAPGWALVLLLHGAVLWAMLQASGPAPTLLEPLAQTLLIQEVEILPPQAQPTDVPVPPPRPAPPPPKPVPAQRAYTTLEPVPLQSPVPPVPPPVTVPRAQPAPAPPAPAAPPPLAPAKEPPVTAPQPALATVAVATDRTPALPAAAPVVASESRVSPQVPTRTAIASQFPAAAIPPRLGAPVADVPHTPVLASESRAASAQTTPHTGQIAAAPSASPAMAAPAPTSTSTSALHGDSPAASAANASPQRPAVALSAERSSLPPASESGPSPGRGLVSPAPVSAPAAAPVAAPPTVSIALACPVQVAPDMPAGAFREQGDEWQVTAQIAIRNGVVQSVKILSGPRVFHDKVREAIRKYQCKADGGEVLATQVFRFKLGQ